MKLRHEKTYTKLDSTTCQALVAQKSRKVSPVQGAREVLVTQGAWKGPASLLAREASIFGTVSVAMSGREDSSGKASEVLDGRAGGQPPI